jgi:phosphatidylserine/phosphatidylglycerophosphate/cardiolipin synthase-like enzyme
LLPTALVLAWVIGAVWISHKRVPPGVHIAGPWQALSAQSLRFMRDLTAADANGAPLVERQIDAELLRMISQARELVLVDTGLFGDLPAAGPDASHLRAAPPIATELADALVRAKRQQPALSVLVLTDPASQSIGGAQDLLQRVRAAGMTVLAVDITRLRAPDPSFAAFWGLCCAWWTRTISAGDWPNPIGVGPVQVPLGVWGALQGYQRSHRQLLIADDGAGGLAALVFSRPLHAEAGIHSATALELSGIALEPLLESEFAVAQFSGWSDDGAMQERSQRLLEQQRRAVLPAAAATARARVLTEAAIAETLVARIDATTKGDRIEIAALYLSQRELVRALLDASRRGVEVRLLLDPGKDGYGYARSGIPNQQVASELISASDGALRVRWYRTHGERFSPGFVLIQSAQNCWLLLGTSELTRYDLNDFNLTAAVLAELPASAAAASDALAWFDRLWYNRAPSGTEYTSDAEVYTDPSPLRYWEYRLLEATGTAFY